MSADWPPNYVVVFEHRCQPLLLVVVTLPWAEGRACWLGGQVVLTLVRRLKGWKVTTTMGRKQADY